MKRIVIGVTLLASTIALPQPAPAQNGAVGGAIVGGVLGGVIGGAATGRTSGAIAGAVIGGVTGAAIGAQAEQRHGYYWYQGACYRRVQGGYTQVSPRFCG